MSGPTDPPAFVRGHHPTANQSLLPVLLWLNRRELAHRFPDWQPQTSPIRSSKTP